LNDIGRNFLLESRKKIAKCLMRNFTCRSTFLYAYQEWIRGGAGKGQRWIRNVLGVEQAKDRDGTGRDSVWSRNGTEVVK
jgi:hypothetical protein